MTGTVVFVPWYEPGDYYRFKNMNGGRQLPSSYDDWKDAVVREVVNLLAQGSVAQIVRLSPEGYFRWLAVRCAADTSAERVAYLAETIGLTGCAAAPGSLLSRWPETPTAH